MAEQIDERKGRIPTQLPQMKNIPVDDKMFKFDGAWLPDVDAALLGPKNFQKLVNMRYIDGGIEGVNGYTKYNSGAAISTYTNITNGIHFLNNQDDDSYLVVHANDGTNAGKVLYNETAIGSQDASDPTDFDSNIIWTDNSASLTPRFCKTPGSGIAYCNAEESAIWAGTETAVGAVFATRNSSDEFPVDITDKILNSQSDTANKWSPSSIHYTDETTYKWTAGGGANEFYCELLAGGDPSLSDPVGVVDGSGDEVSEGTLNSLDGAAHAWAYGDGGGGFSTINVSLSDDSDPDTGNFELYSQHRLIIMTTRPAQGFKFYISTANARAQTIEAANVQYWNGSSWTNVSSLTDGTATAGATMAKTGTISFSDTSTVAKPKHFEELYLYAYRVNLGIANPSIYRITCDLDMQDIVDVWDGIYRQPVQCQFYDQGTTSYEDFTLHVSESSTTSTPVGLYLGDTTTSDAVFLGFEDQISAVKITMLGNLVNSADTSVLTVRYWDGENWADASATDGTASNGKTFGQSGLIYWSVPSDEYPRTLFGSVGYFYRLSVSAALDASGTQDKDGYVADIITGIPAQRAVSPFKFPVKFKSKLMLCNYEQGDEGNRVDYCADNAPDVWNGEDSSDDGFQSLYFGGTEGLTCGTQLYNRFGSNIFAVLLMFKNSEVYLLTGDGPDDYKIYPVSYTIGNPAPLTLSTAEVGFQLGEEVARNVALWVSHRGPMMFDGAILYPIQGIENFFDPNEAESVDFDNLDISRAWFDSTYSEWNVLLPVSTTSGATQSTLNRWFCYDLVRKKWFEKDTSVADFPQCGIRAVGDGGDHYVYGGSTTGYVYRLENGTSWSGTAITNTIWTGDFFPTNDEWDITNLKRIRVIVRGVDEDGAIMKVYYYKDTAGESGQVVDYVDVEADLSHNGSAGVYFQDVEQGLANSGNAGVSWFKEIATIFYLDIDIGLERLFRETKVLNKSSWAHSLKFEFTSSSTAKGLRPVGWGYQAEFDRKEEVSSY